MTVAAAPVTHYRARGTLQAIAVYRSIPLELERAPVVFALHQLLPNHGVRPEKFQGPRGDADRWDALNRSSFPIRALAKCGQAWFSLIVWVPARIRKGCAEERA